MGIVFHVRGVRILFVLDGEELQYTLRFKKNPR